MNESPKRAIIVGVTMFVTLMTCRVAHECPPQHAQVGEEAVEETVAGLCPGIDWRTFVVYHHGEPIAIYEIAEIGGCKNLGRCVCSFFAGTLIEKWTSKKTAGNRHPVVIIPEGVVACEIEGCRARIGNVSHYHPDDDENMIGIIFDIDPNAVEPPVEVRGIIIEAEDAPGQGGGGNNG